MTTLKKARKEGRLEEFIAEHEKDLPGDENKLDAILRRAAEKSSKAPATSPPDVPESCDDTQTRRRTSEDASPKRGRGSRGSKA